MNRVQVVDSYSIRTWVSSIVLLPICLYFCLNRGAYTFVDNADLLIHEAGHFFFHFFGDFIHAAGGTLMQIILPSVLIWHFLYHDYKLGTQVSLLWLGHNFMNISIYAADAQAQQLPLLGNGYHDWHYMLNRLDLLAYDHVFGNVFFTLAILCFLLLLLLPARVGWQQG